MSSDPASDASRYPILAGPVRHEMVVLRSRFLACLEEVRDEPQAMQLLARARQQFPDATHHCWAFLIGPPGSSARMGCSDAGEPHGTAGRPMLESLLHGGVGDLGAVVVRWFGGVKLGKGPLARAYAQVVADALGPAPRGRRTEWVAVDLAAGYADAETLGRLHPRFEVELLEQTFGEQVQQRLRLPVGRLAAFTDAVTQATAGRARLKPRPRP